MKKVLLFILAIILFGSCDSQPLNGCTQELVVQEKFMCPAGYKMRVSESNNPTRVYTVSVGKYTYDTTNPGDTLIVKYGDE